MPKKGYKTVAGRSIPVEYVEAIERLLKDPKFIREMRLEGHGRISAALVLRKALRQYLEDKGYHINQAKDK